MVGKFLGLDGGVGFGRICVVLPQPGRGEQDIAERFKGS